ncbi:MAG TPA: VCBS repeat-containing protein [Nevskiaceae bacterium]|nr:VCBS repeat-containing protein [Nevskiaceae bacterium]
MVRFIMWCAVATWLLVMGGLHPATAATARNPGFPSATEIEVACCDTPTALDVAMYPEGGGYVVAWGAIVGNGRYVRARKYAADGTPGPVVSLGSSGYAPIVDVLPDGGFWLVWPGDGNGLDILAARFDADSVQVGTTLTVNTTTTNHQMYPALATDRKGRALIAWQSKDQDGSGEGIYAQRLAADGTLDGVEFRVNPETTGDQFYPSVAIVGPISSATGGRFAVAWQSHTGTGFASPTGVGTAWLRLFNNNGSERRLVQLGEAGDLVEEKQPTVAMDGNGKMVVSWYDVNPLDGTPPAILRVQRFDPIGHPKGVAIEVASPINAVRHGDSVREPATLAVDWRGGYTVAWKDFVPGTDFARFRRYDNTGRPIGPARAFPVDDTGQEWPVVAGDGDGDFVLGWNFRCGACGSASVNVRPFEGSSLSQVELPDLDGNGQPDKALFFESLERAVVHTRNADGTLIAKSKFSLPHSSVDDAVAVGDVSGDGIPDLAVLATAPGIHTRVAIQNSVTGVRTHLLTSNWSSDMLTAMAAGDVDHDGTPDVTLLALQSHFGTTQILTRTRNVCADCAEDAPIDFEHAPGAEADFLPEALAIVPRPTAESDAIAVLWSKIGQPPRVSVRARVSADNFTVLADHVVDTLATGVDVAVIKDADLGANARDVAILGVDGEGQVRVTLREVVYTSTEVRNINFGTTHTPIALRVIPDLDGNGVPELAVLLRSADAPAHIAIRDAVSGELVRDIDLGDVGAVQAMGLDVAPDLNGNGKVELDALMLRVNGARPQTRTWDTKSTRLLHSLNW